MSATYTGIDHNLVNCGPNASVAYSTSGALGIWSTNVKLLTTQIQTLSSNDISREEIS